MYMIFKLLLMKENLVILLSFVLLLMLKLTIVSDTIKEYDYLPDSYCLLSQIERIE